MRSKRKGFEELLLAGMQEVVDIAEGRRAPSRVHSFPLTARNAEASEPNAFNAVRVVALRRQLKFSQKLFADALNVSLGTVRSWEQGARVPDGASTRLLELIESHPSLAAGFVHARSSGHSPDPVAARLQLASSTESDPYAPFPRERLEERAVQETGALEALRKQLEYLTKVVLSMREEQAVLRRDVLTSTTAATRKASPVTLGNFQLGTSTAD